MLLKFILKIPYTAGDFMIYVEYAKIEDTLTRCDTHFHHGYEIYYMLSGSVRYFIEDKVYDIRHGNFVLIKPHVLHKTIYCGECTASERVLIEFDESDIEDFLKLDGEVLKCFESAVITIPASQTNKIETMLKTMLEENENPLVVKSLLACCLVMLCRRYEVSGKSEGISLNKEDGQIIEIVKYLNAHYNEDISLRSIAERFYISPSYLSHKFKKITGFTYIEYLCSLRIKKAVSLLEETHMNVTEIALSTGFSTSNHFCKTFKAVMGISPLKYRKKL